VVHADGPEEGEAGSEGVDVHTGVHTGTEVFQAVSQGVRQLNVGCGTGFLHVVARDGDGVELGHVFRGVLENVGDDLHRKIGRIDIGIPHHEFLEDIVLDGPGHFFQLGTLFQPGVDVKGQNGQDGAVHGHGDGHLVQGNAIEEYFHVFHRADGDTGLAHVTYHAFVVGVVATVCGQVEGHGEALLAGSQVAAVEGVGFFSGGEAGVLTDGPGTHGVHNAVGATQEGTHTGSVVQVFHAFQVGFGVDRFYLNLFRGFPVFFNAVGLFPCFRVVAGHTGKYVDLFEVWFHESVMLIDA
jgi:hypothetical protein